MNREGGRTVGSGRVATIIDQSATRIAKLAKIQPRASLLASGFIYANVLGDSLGQFLYAKHARTDYSRDKIK